MHGVYVFLWPSQGLLYNSQGVLHVLIILGQNHTYSMREVDYSIGLKKEIVCFL